MLRHVKGHYDILRHIQALLRHIELYSNIFRMCCNPCIYNSTIFRTLTHLEPEASSKACLTCQMIKHVQSLIRSVYSIFFEDIQGHSGILMHIQTHSQARNQMGKGRPSLMFFEKCPDFGKKALIVSICGLNFPFKIQFIQENKHQHISLQEPFSCDFGQTI